MKASIRKIVWNDWPALFSFVAVPIVWAIHFAFPYLKRGADAPDEGFALGLSILAAAALAWRIARVRGLFSSGNAVDGIVESVRIVKDRGRLEYSYRVGGRAMTGWCPVHKSKQVLGLRAGQKLTVLVDRAKPGRSIVADLFVA
jgi:hypothetical protein